MESEETPDWPSHTPDRARWPELFADLEGQLAAAVSADLAAEVADRTRREVGLLRLFDRVRGALGTEVSVRLLGGQCAQGRLDAAGPGWLLLVGPGGREWLVFASAIAAMSGLTHRSDVAGARVAERLGVGIALRGIARSRCAVTVALTDGQSLCGVIDRVGADFVDLALLPPGELRRTPDTRSLTVPLSSVAVVRRDG